MRPAPVTSARMCLCFVMIFPFSLRVSRDVRLRPLASQRPLWIREATIDQAERCRLHLLKELSRLGRIASCRARERRGNHRGTRWHVLGKVTVSGWRGAQPLGRDAMDV